MTGKENLQKQAQPIERALRKLHSARTQLKKDKVRRAMKLLKEATGVLDDRLMEINIASIHGWEVVEQLKIADRLGGSRKL